VRAHLGVGDSFLARRALENVIGEIGSSRSSWATARHRRARNLSNRSALRALSRCTLDDMTNMTHTRSSPMSKAMTIAEAKAHFSECVKAAEGGETVLITLIQEKCFGGNPDAGHKTQIDQVQNGIDNCQALTLINCAKGHPMAGL
jgi:hypothetical protein